MEQYSHEITINSYSGSHFEIGAQLGKKANEKFGPNYVDNALANIKDVSLYEALGLHFDLTPNYINTVFPIVEGIISKVHPQLLEEMKGFAQSTEEDYKRFVVFTSNFGNDTGCSQFYVNGYLARNYDDAPGAVENEFPIIKPQGSISSIGASTGYIERLDGMNEEGLAVSLTFGAGYPAKQHGIGAAMLQRIMLDKAATVDEALSIFKSTSYVSPNNVMICDALGNGALIEGSGGKHVIRQSDELLFCANSYQSPEMKKEQKLKNPTTLWRENQMQLRIPNLYNEIAMMDFLTADFPNGLFEPYFTDGLGTLWSVIYNPANRSVYLAVGNKNDDREEFRFDFTNPGDLRNLPTSIKTTLRDVDLGKRIPQYK
jgi:predicted choloylglycine hydrolase